jgi:PKHD-type hydroxylase
MIACIPEVLSRQDVETLRQGLADGEFVDGKLTAGKFASHVKQNLQLKRSETTLATLEALVSQRLAKHPTFSRLALPRAMARPLFNRYEPGMAYGRHVDSPIMGDGLRSDLSVTVFLSEVDSYDGGELSIETDLGAEQVKLAAGDAVLYPATTIHWVEPVRRGVRLAAVSWVQSLVRDHAMRRIVHDLSLVMDRLGDLDPTSENAQLLYRAYANLIRLVAD